MKKLVRELLPLWVYGFTLWVYGFTAGFTVGVVVFAWIYIGTT